MWFDTACIRFRSLAREHVIHFLSNPIFVFELVPVGRDEHEHIIVQLQINRNWSSRFDDLANLSHYGVQQLLGQIGIQLSNLSNFLNCQLFS